MYIAEQQTTTNQLFERLELFFAAEQQPSELELRRLEKEALNLVKIYPAGASLIRAGLAALQWDAEKTRYLIENACSLERTSVQYMNSALTFKFLNDMVSAADYAKQSLQMAVNDREFVVKAVSYLTMAGEVHEAQKILIAHQKMGLDLDKLTEEISEFSLAMDELGVSPDRLRFELGAAFGLLAKHRVRCSEIILSKDFDPDGGYGLSVGLIFVGDLASEIRLEAELAELFIQEPGWNPSLLSVEFKYKLKNVLQLA